MKARYQYRFYPTNQQCRRFARLFGCVRVVWNDAAFSSKFSEKLPGYDRLSGLSLPVKKAEKRKCLQDLSSVILQQTLRDLAAACKNFFTSHPGSSKDSQTDASRLKNKTNDRPAEFAKAAFSLEAGRVCLAKIGTFTPIWFGELPPEPSSVTLIKDRFTRDFLSFVFNKIVARDSTPIERASGSDLECKIFAAIGNLSAVASPVLSLKNKQTQGLHWETKTTVLKKFSIDRNW